MNNLPSAVLARSGAAVAAGALLAAAVAVGGAAATSASATATAKPVGSATVKDSRNDMLGHGADIFSVRLVNRDRVRVVIQHRNLVRSWKPASSGTVYVDTDRSTAGPDYALVAGLYSGTDYSLLHTDGWKIRYRKPVEGRYQMRLRFDTDRTVVTMSRAALGRPQDVRVAVHTAGDDGDGHTIHDWLKGTNRFSPWVARG
jgi:hypothetical protein